MTDLPFAGGADTTVGPVPGYYADPSIPGYVRYWGGTAWVPGTSRPTPAEGEVLEPPRFLGRPARPAGARYVPPPSGSGVGAGGTGADMAGGGADPGTGAGPWAGPGGRPGDAGPGGAAGSGGAAGPGDGGGAGGGTVLGPGDTGPVYFDQTTGGASFVLAPQAELELRRQADIEARAALEQAPARRQARGPAPAHVQAPAQGHPSGPGQAHGPGQAYGPGQAKAQWGGHPFTSALPQADEGRVPHVPGSVLRVAEPGPRSAAAAPASRGEAAALAAPTAYADPQTVPAPVPHQSTGGAEPAGPGPAAGGSGWQADPRAQPGLLETGGSPRWVSWGVLPGSTEAQPEGGAEAGAGIRAEARPEAAGAQAATSGPARTKAEVQHRAEVRTEARAEVRAEVRAEPEEMPGAVAGAAGSPAAGATTARPRSGPAVPPGARTPARPAGATRATTPVPAAAADRAPATAAPATAAAAAVTATGPARRPAAGRKPAPRPAAGLGRRLFARVVDTTVMAIVAVAAGLPLASSATEHVQDKLERARTASNLAGRQIQVWLVDGVVMGKAGVLLAVLLFVGILYEVLPTARTGQTFGKRLARIRVVDAAEARPAARTKGSGTARPAARTGTAARAKQRKAGAGTPTLGRSLLRWIVGQLASALVIGLCWPLFDRRARRGWQDRAARTRVVRA
ncbi:RDD family protein [Kitasatospora indigofera]|uniref:RDD family protein n=1 Tax=Kitasatospora indigofera TaxID=67307 RepID=UPI0036B4EFE7